MECLTPDAEDQSPNKHESEALLESSKCHNALTGRNQRRLNDHHRACPKFIDEMATNKRQDNVRKRVDGVEPRVLLLRHL